MSREQTTDVLVVGAGPAGCAAAITLAQLGREVTLVERSTFPRYHVGESLLPYCWWTLERLGVLPAITSAAFQVKRSVQFVTPEGRLSSPFYFHHHSDHPSATTWQVDRASFDNLLLERAIELGVKVYTDTRAQRLIEDETGAVAGAVVLHKGERLHIRSRMMIDASGRDGFVRGQRGWREAEPALQRVALWTYFDGATRDDGDDEGATTVVKLPRDGWFWWIPLSNGRVSVGVVTQRDELFHAARDRATAFESMVHQNPWVAKRLRHAQQVGPLRVTSDYSYRSRYCADDGVVLAGDAFAFLDPVFSSGVFLALRTGEEAANAVHAALERDTNAASAFEFYGHWVCRGMEAMRALVFSFYDPEFSMGQLIRAHPDLKDDVTDLLIGNLFRDYDALFSALAEVGTLPPQLTYGRAAEGRTVA